MSSLKENKVLNFFHQHSFQEKVSQKHLASSALCNFPDPSIQKLKQELFETLKSPEKIADKAYDFIRQKILYSFDDWAILATQTYAKATGMCFNKTNLMVALLRSAQIPAVYTVFWIRKDGFRFTATRELFQKVQPLTVHIYCEAYLGERIGWRRFVDSSLDTRLRQVLEKQGYNSFENIVLDKPIERFSSPEEVIEWRKKYKRDLGAEETITKEDREKANRRLEGLRCFQIP